MYRILLADDEGIMLASIKNIIETNFGNLCEIATAKTGRVVVEMTDECKPDIVFMDIQMPGINGLEAIKQIQEKHDNILFIVITAYDKFSYAKDAISLGAFEYLTKPVKKQVLVDVLSKAMQQVDKERKNKIDNIRIKEKLETVVPIIESGYINNVLLQDKYESENNYYLELMDIGEKYGYVILLQFGESLENGNLTNPVGTSMRIQKFYQVVRTIIKQYYPAIIGPVMSNKMILVVPYHTQSLVYEERIRMIELTRNLLRNLEEQIDAHFRAGIGRPKTMEEIKESYLEALRASKEGKGRVAHVEDYPIGYGYEDDYPVDLERNLFQAIENGEKDIAVEQAKAFYDWMIAVHSNHMDNICLKVLEFVMRAEHTAFLNGGINYGFLYRENYLPTVMTMQEHGELKQWFLSKIAEVCHNITAKREEKSVSLINQAKNYIKQNYEKEISLDEVSRMINISPYYFSKLFKEETGENFIDYLTKIRIQHAKELLKNPAYSIKEVCAKSGYSDPNYFSRIFKKKENLTPSEYRERRL